MASSITNPDSEISTWLGSHHPHSQGVHPICYMGHVLTRRLLLSMMTMMMARDFKAPLSFGCSLSLHVLLQSVLGFIYRVLIMSFHRSPCWVNYLPKQIRYCYVQEEQRSHRQYVDEESGTRIHNHFCKSQDFRISFTIPFYIPRYNPRGIKLGKLINI